MSGRAIRITLDCDDDCWRMTLSTDSDVNYSRIQSELIAPCAGVSIRDSPSRQRHDERHLLVDRAMSMHIAFGGMSFLTGIGALVVVKGSAKHLFLGKGFVISMLLMCVSAVNIAYSRNIMDSLFVGLITIYLVVTAWMTVRDKKNGIGVLNYIFLIFVLLVGASAF